MITCDHEHPAFCDACGKWYVDRYTDRIIQSMLDRIAKLEAQLRAVK